MRVDHDIFFLPSSTLSNESLRSENDSLFIYPLLNMDSDVRRDIINHNNLVKLNEDRKVLIQLKKVFTKPEKIHIFQFLVFLLWFLFFKKKHIVIPEVNIVKLYRSRFSFLFFHDSGNSLTVATVDTY